MSDTAIYELARRAGIAVEWTNYADEPQRVSLDALRRILAALGLPCDNADALAYSQQFLEKVRLPPVLTATVNEAIDLPIDANDAPATVSVRYEDGRTEEIALRRSADRVQLPAIATPGYHRVQIGREMTSVAVAPRRCVTAADKASGRPVWGLAAQLYGLRSSGDCGIGDVAGVIALAEAAAHEGADALALTPTHALFSADPRHFSPYSPSSRLFYNPLHADPAAVFPPARIEKARSEANGDAEGSLALEASPLIDWSRSSQLKLNGFRRLFDDFYSTDLAAPSPAALASDFVTFRSAGGAALEAHGVFEALHAARLAVDPAAWNWHDWPKEWRRPDSAAVKDFATRSQREVTFHVFLQWLADRSLDVAQRAAKDAGLRVGLISDLAVGMNSGGSQSWANQADILNGLQIGAPPDLFNKRGQNWGLTTFSPRALVDSGFASFLATIRSCMRHAGGVRIDHAMGLMRLWVIPDGADPSEGAYLNYPLIDLLRLAALESHRHEAIVIGEDLGTVPPGFRDRLAENGIYGMKVLWFERQDEGFVSPADWPVPATAMSSTHDLPTVAGWWLGRDIEVRAQCGFIKDLKSEQAARAQDRQALWRAFRAAKAAVGGMPAPQQHARVVDAAVKFIGRTPSRLTLLPLEDALGLLDQPNLPATIDEQPNWRRRYPGEAGKLLEPPHVRDRLRPLVKRQAISRKTK
jgi:4-alpha-glucanotransferase